MLWLDGVLAVPFIGIRIKPAYNSASAFQDRIGDFIEYLSQSYDEFEIKRLDIWGYSITPKETGLAFKISPKNILAQSAYTIQEKPTPGGLPRYIYPEIKNYSEKIDELKKIINKLFEVMEGIKGFKYDRIGIVADVMLDEEAIPPAIKIWIEDLGKTIGGEVITSDLMLLKKIEDGNKYIEQCHHHLSFNKDTPEVGYNIKLDWQRKYNDYQPLDFKSLKTVFSDCLGKATNYFDKFGEGVKEVE